MLKLILLSYDRVNIGRFYERCRNRQKWLQQNLFHYDEKSFKQGYVCVLIYQYS